MLAAEVKSLPLKATQNHENNENDAVLIIATNLSDLKNYNVYEAYGTELETIKQYNDQFERELTFTVINKRRVIYSPTGPVDRDYDDVRRIADAVDAAIEKASGIGSKRPLLINCARHVFKLADQVALLAAFQSAHIPLELREANKSSNLFSFESLTFVPSPESTEAESTDLIKLVNAIELGRIVTRDIGGSDPERMAPPRVLEYCQNAFASDDSIKMTVVQGQETFEKEYPLFAAVNRACDKVERHKGQIIKFLYEPKDGKVDTTLFLVGKGITYDTGGADVKAGGHMAGMHRDKCGAAFVAGYFKTLALLKPKGLKVYGTMCVTRNSIGEECYVADEIITARSKKRVRVGNTDAEGRMAMADLLCEAKEIAMNEVNPQLFTIATLTGHVIRAYGPNYTAVMCNGPARALNTDSNLQNIGDSIGDPFEISTIRRDDFKTVAGKSIYEDLLQSTNNPSTAEPRGHQFPSAFLIQASGLEKHGNNSTTKKLPYAHVDIAGSSGPFPGLPTGSPLPSFTYQYIVPRL